MGVTAHNFAMQHNLTKGVVSGDPITFAIFYWLKVSHRSHLHSKGRDYKEWESLGATRVYSANTPRLNVSSYFVAYGNEDKMDPGDSHMWIWILVLLLQDFGQII